MNGERKEMWRNEITWGITKVLFFLEGNALEWEMMTFLGDGENEDNEKRVFRQMITVLWDLGESGGWNGDSKEGWCGSSVNKIGFM